MEAKNIMSDTLMVTELAQELGISPLDLFMYWINTGEIKNVSVSVVFQNEEEIKVDFCKDTIEEIINQSSTKPVNQTSTYEEEKKELGQKLVNINIGNNFSRSGIPVVGITSFPKGIIHLSSEQKKHITMGAYVYTTGDISSQYKAIPNVNIRGIIFEHTPQKITMLKCIGCGYNAIQASANQKDGWRFPTIQECQTMVNHKLRLNDKLAEMKKKQIDDSSMIFCKGGDTNLVIFNVANQKIYTDLTPEFTKEDRTFSLYLMKELRIV